MPSIFIDCGDCCNSPTPMRVYSTLGEAMEKGGDWILEFLIDQDSPAVRQWSRRTWVQGDAWIETTPNA